MILMTFILLLLLLVMIGMFFAIGGLMLKIIYTFCIGLPIALCLCVTGMVLCITIIGIPVGLLLFRAAGFVLAPFR